MEEMDSKDISETESTEFGKQLCIYVCVCMLCESGKNESMVKVGGMGPIFCFAGCFVLFCFAYKRLSRC